MSEDRKTAAEEFKKIHSTGTSSYNEADYLKPGGTHMRFWSDSDLTFTGVPTMTISANVEPSAMTFRAIEGKEVLKIDNEGRLIPGKDMSMDEVTQGVFAALATTLPKYAEIARLRAALEDAAKILDSLDYEGAAAEARAALQPK